jgi:hypothetical protein
VLENSAFENNPIFEALRDEPGEIYGCVDTDGGEGCRRINSRAKGFARKCAELGSRDECDAIFALP